MKSATQPLTTSWGSRIIPRPRNCTVFSSLLIPTTLSRITISGSPTGCSAGILRNSWNRLAVSLGLKQWDLFLNLGLVYLEDGNTDAATDTLATAVALGPGHPEAHFNLGLAYERRGMLAEARRQMLTSLQIDPNQAEARNMLGVIYVEEGNLRNCS